MSGASDVRGRLERAFRSFERAAGTLEERHSDLQHKVDRLERQLVDAHRRLEAVLDALDGGVAVVAADGRVMRTNRAFDDMVPVRGDRRLEPEPLLRLVAAAEDNGGTVRLRRATPGGMRDLSATLVPVGDHERTRVLTVQDVTEIRREEEEGGRRRRLEALGRMAAELAHEVRNPLGSIRLFASMLLEDLGESPHQRGMAEQILAATAGLEATVSNLLAFASPARGARKRVDLARLAGEACSLLRPACSVRGVRLDGPGSDAACPVHGDPEGLRQVLLNLLGNALAATEGGGRIRVDVTAADDRATIVVEDDGRGIATEDLPRVFDPFFTRTAGGTGLGLSIVHRTVEQHGGRIALDSRPGSGTRARVELPGSPCAAEVASHA